MQKNGIVSAPRTHDSGLDYNIVVYEKTPALHEFSSTLLCSYNRFTSGSRALQSFGDAQGGRVDFYRFSVQKALGTVPASLKDAERVWDQADCTRHPERLLDAVERFAETGQCEDPYARLLFRFGYAQGGHLCVPVYRREDLPVIETLERLTETHLYAGMEAALSAAGKQPPLLCEAHGVALGDVANELYHIVFGQLNEALTARQFVARPPYRPGEGRYLKSIELL